jgi:hypothetical protein
MPTTEETAELERAVEECGMGLPRMFMENYLWIEDEDQRLIPFRFDENQDYYYRETFLQLPATPEGDRYDQPMYVHSLKDRKARSTTFWIGAAFAFMCCLKGFPCLVVIDSEKNLTAILKMVDIFYNNLPKWMRPAKGHWGMEWRELQFGHGKITPEAGGSVDKGHFQHTLSSVMVFSSARSTNFARASTSKMVVRTENAHYDRTFEREMDTAVEESLPPRAWVIDESTPAGPDGGFYTRFQSLRTGMRTGVQLVRRWFDRRENQLSSIDPTVIGANRGDLVLTEEEEALIGRMPEIDGVSYDDRIRWRRRGIQRAVDSAWGDEDFGKGRFLSEHPEDDVTCWFSTESPVLPLERINQMLLSQKEPIEQSIPYPGVRLRIWERPAVGHVYVGGHDPGRSVSGDANALQIIDAQTGVHVAEMYGRANVTMFTIEVCKLMERYNKGLLVIEANGMGVSANETADRTCGYTNLYRPRPRNPNNPSERREPGWNWNQRKAKMHEDLWRAIHEGSLITYSEDLVLDLRRYNPDMDHTPDRVMAINLALSAREERLHSLMTQVGRQSVGRGRPVVIQPVPYR